MSHLETMQKYLSQMHEVHNESTQACLERHKVSRGCIYENAAERLESFEHVVQTQHNMTMGRLEALESRSPYPGITAVTRQAQSTQLSGEVPPLASAALRSSCSSRQPHARAVSSEPTLLTPCREPQQTIHLMQSMPPLGQTYGGAAPPPVNSRPKSPGSLRSSASGPLAWAQLQQQQQLQIQISAPSTPSTPGPSATPLQSPQASLAPPQVHLQHSRMLGGSASSSSLAIHLHQPPREPIACASDDFRRPGTPQRYSNATLVRRDLASSDASVCLG